MNRRGWLFGGAGALALAGGLAWRLREEGAADSTETAPAELWATRWPRPEGGELVMAGMRGRPLLLNFWATWCAPCVRELPLLDRFQASQGEHGWQVIGLAVDRPELVRPFLQRLPVRFVQVVLEAEGLVWSQRLGNHHGGLPFTVAINRQGRIARRKTGEIGDAELQSWTSSA